MSKLECNIVEDLLPSFADGLVNEKTAEEINEHFAECESCAGLYNEIISGEKPEQKTAEKEIDYLKKIKKKNKAVIASILGVLTLIFVIATGVYSFIGTTDEAYSLSSISVTDNLMSAEINLFSSANSITKVSAKEIDGIVTISVRSSLFSLNKKGSKDFRFIAEQYINKIQTSDGRVLWENGEIISQKINDIYNAKVKYIGDNTAVLNLINKIDFSDELKCESHSIHLVTDEKPYGLEIYDIISNEELFSTFTNESYEQKIKSIAFIILACIENADFVKLDYTLPDGTEKTYKLTVDEANNHLFLIQESESIKSFSESHYNLKLLIDEVGQQLISSAELEYKPYLIENKEIIFTISNNPIDKKYLDIQNNTPLFDATKEGKNYIDWAEAYEKQYKIICKAILDYAENNPDTEDYVRKLLTEAVGNIEDYNKYNDIMADLYYLCIGAKYGPGGGTLKRNRIYLNEARTKTLRLAELAYFLNADFEWVE